MQMQTVFVLVATASYRGAKCTLCLNLRAFIEGRGLNQQGLKCYNIDKILFKSFQANSWFSLCIVKREIVLAEKQAEFSCRNRVE